MPGRIIAALGSRFQVATPGSVRLAFETGHHRYLTELGTQSPPVMGDFVTISGGEDGDMAITGVLSRRSLFARKRPGSTEQQPLVANLDLLVVVTDPGGDFSLRRVERYVEALRAGCDAPVLLAINKADTVRDAPARAAEARAAIPGIDAVAVSARTGAGLGELGARWAAGETVVLAGSSGVGKSTLVNALCGTSADVGELRGDGRGKHKTTARRAYATTDGALLIDTPGLREVGLFTEDGDSGTAFPEILELEDQCRFRDCRHEHEPGCAVRGAVEAGTIDPERYESYLRLRAEAASTAAEYRERKRRWEKEISQEVKRMRKSRHTR